MSVSDDIVENGRSEISQRVIHLDKVCFPESQVSRLPLESCKQHCKGHERLVVLKPDTLQLPFALLGYARQFFVANALKFEDREERSMNQCRSRQKLLESFERHWSLLISGEIPMDQSLVHTFSWGNSYGPMVLKVLLKFPPTLALVHGWLFPVRRTRPSTECLVNFVGDAPEQSKSRHVYTISFL